MDCIPKELFIPLTLTVGSGVAGIGMLLIPCIPPIPMFPTFWFIPACDMAIWLYCGPCMLFIPGVGVRGWWCD